MSWKMKKKIKISFDGILNPYLLFFCVWGGSFFLEYLSLVPVIRSFEYYQYAIVCAVVLAPFFVAWIISRKRRAVAWISEEDVVRKNNLKNLLALFWLVATVFEIFYSGGFPLLWKIFGIDKDYFDFGISGLHGLLNGIFFLLVQIDMLDYFLSGKKASLVFPFFALIWTVVIFSRQMTIVLFLQTLFMYMCFSGRAMLLKLIAYAFILVVLFGVVGNIRTGNEEFYSLVGVSSGWFLLLPAGFLWVYVYMASPISNLMYNLFIDKPVPNYDIGSFFVTLFPKFLRTEMFKSDNWNPNNLPFELTGNLENYNLNVGTAFMSGVVSFGFVGLLGMVVIHLVAAYLLRRSRGWNSVLFYPVVLTSLALSIFAPSLLSLTALFQIILIALLKFSYKIR